MLGKNKNYRQHAINAIWQALRTFKAIQLMNFLPT
jgi:hypothetical protein